ncbi:hypothetical protein A7K91_05060 [Paenibacillus oryzae]|uniref:ABC transporter permease n=1 Tax=Paenibacillus oryzae TaxID=1844972 RepID=A0A1A5YHS6_9BACL|nr:hypothetical protein [Paenibacillus oryzae]OBR64950.1 hypothetical protein A7K91_05060 [Paenibacillus oryzae]
MGKLFRYELRLIAFNRFYIGFFAVSLCFGWLILSTGTIQGVAHTAPFSPWSFGSYLTDLMPLLSIALLFMVWSFDSGQARRAKPLLNAATIAPFRHAAVKCAAAATAWLLLSAAIMLLGIGFLIFIFGNAVSIPALLAPAVSILLPVILFLMGSGLLALSRSRKIFLGLPPALLALHLLPLPSWMHLLATNFYSTYPLHMDMVDPGFTVPVSFIAGKLGYTLAGMIMLALALRKKYSCHT